MGDKGVGKRMGPLCAEVDSGGAVVLPVLLQGEGQRFVAAVAIAGGDAEVHPVNALERGERVMQHMVVVDGQDVTRVEPDLVDADERGVW